MVNNCCRTECAKMRGQCGFRLWCVLLSLVCLLCVRESAADNDTLYMTPNNDKYVKYGDDLEILCTATGISTSEDLYFTLAGQVLKSDIVNSTTRRLYIKHPNQNNRSAYYCENSRTRKNNFVGVYVASPPADVTDFNCISRNFDILNCSWTTPDKYIFTKYSLTFKVNGNEVTPSCTANVVQLSLTRYCTWYTNGAPRYRQLVEVLDFHLESSNKFGNKTQYFNIDHYSIVKPDPPYNLKTINVTPHSVTLQWVIPNNIIHFLKGGIEHKIEYQIAKIDNPSDFRRVPEKYTSLLPPNNKTYTFTLEDLPYAHMKYGVRIYIKPKKAVSDLFWSDFNNTQFYTASELPIKPPEMEAGAFFQSKFDNHRVLYVYWKQLEEYDEAGANFTYKVQMSNVSTPLYPDKNKSLGYLHLDSAPLDAIEITVWSSNEKGLSVNSSHLYIPPESEVRSLRITSFTKLAYENGTYELSWAEIQNIDNYTLFWCQHNTTDICNGRINFAVLDANKNKHIIDLPRDYRYQFALSANNGTKSSGMNWAKCDISKDGIAMYGFPIRFTDHDAPGKTFVKLKWSMDCTLKDGIITGYNITYCPIVGTSNVCKTHGLEPPYIIEDPDRNSVNITDLRPYTTYEFRMALNTIYGLKTIENNTVRITTLEDTPTSPRNVTIYDVSSESLMMSWSLPEYINTHVSKIKYVIRNFGIKFREFKYEDKWINLSRIDVLVDELHGYVNYSLSVEACNEGIDIHHHPCSEFTEAQLIQTKTGKPSQMRSPSLKYNLLSWDPPQWPGGFLDLYQVKIVKDGKDIIFINTTETSQPVPSCEGAVQNETYQVRALNYDAETGLNGGGLVFEGNWSEASTLICKSRNSLFLFFIIMVILMLVGLGCGMLKAYKKIRKMRDIKPEFPKGMFVPEKDITKYQLNGLYPSDKDDTDKPMSDEMLLLPNGKTAVSSTATKQTENDNCGSSDHTDSTVLSDASQGPVNRQNSSSDEESQSSLHSELEPIKVDDKTNIEEIDVPKDEIKITCDKPYISPNVLKKTNTSGYVQPVANPAAGYVQTVSATFKSLPPTSTVQPASSGYVMAGLPQPIFTTGVAPPSVTNLPAASSGYIRPEDAQIRSPMNFPKLGPSPTKMFGSESLPTMPSVPSMKPNSNSSYIQLQSLDTLPSQKPTVRNTVPSKPASSGYVNPGDAVITKHLRNMTSGVQMEESAILDPAMSPDAYCRFSWSTDPTNDNLHSLLATPHSINPSKN